MHTCHNLQAADAVEYEKTNCKRQESRYHFVEIINENEIKVRKKELNEN